MGNSGGRDLLRQVANVVGAVFQVGATAVASASIQQVTDGAKTPLIEPALYAFFVWGVIFALSLVYAGYQALPRNRENPLLRRVGWFTAVAFFCIGLWSVFVPFERLLFALAMLSVTFACLLAAYLRLARYGRDLLSAGRRPSAAEGWLVAAPVGVFLGWVTAANVVSVDSEAVRFGLVEAGGTGEALLGSALLLLGGLLAAWVVLAGRAGPAQGYLVYAATVLWALVAIVVNQYDASSLTTAAAVAAAVPVALALLGNRRARRAHRGRRVAQPRVV